MSGGPLRTARALTRRRSRHVRNRVGAGQCGHDCVHAPWNVLFGCSQPIEVGLEVSRRITRRTTRPAARGLSRVVYLGSDGVQFDSGTQHVHVFGVAYSGLDHGSADDVGRPQCRFEAAHGVFDSKG